LDVIATALRETKAAFGRAESATVEGRELRLLLVKNPVGANEVLRTLALEPGEHDVLGVLNDNVADGRDVSWIWDTDFELIADRIATVTCGGTRAPELAVRLKYAGVEPARIAVIKELPAALEYALGSRRDGDQPPLYALPTYTGMLALRKLLAKRGRRHGEGT
jgi:UDP-N-acetylmuramyl tripeptide synthase